MMSNTEFQNFIQNTMTLSMQQQLTLRKFEVLVSELSKEELKTLLVDHKKELLYKQNMVTHFLHKDLGCH